MIFPLVEKDDSNKKIKYLIWAYIFLLIFEGALRKWVLPALSSPILVIRDPIAFIILMSTIQNKVLKFNLTIYFLFVTGILAFFCALLFAHGSVIVALFGLRPFLLHLPLIFVIGAVFKKADVLKVGRVLLVLLVPMKLREISEEGQAKTLFITSTFPREGKTFISSNLAATFALSGKKVLLIGMDIRNPRLDEYFNLPERGFTNYLSSKDLKLDDLIIKQDGFEDFHILPAGIIPPNPAELLMSKKVDILFNELKWKYDYIIVDTAPVSLVTDTLLIAKHADCFIYVARANFLEKRMLNIANTLYKEKKLPNLCLLLNDTDSTKGYGYGYGYGVKVQKEPWYKTVFKV